MENPFKWHHYQGEIIVLCVRWYLRYALSYRDLEEMMSERGLSVVHTTIYRWVQRFAPELEKRMRPHLKKSNDSWNTMSYVMTVSKSFLNNKCDWWSCSYKRSHHSLHHNCCFSSCTHRKPMVVKGLKWKRASVFIISFSARIRAFLMLKCH